MTRMVQTMLVAVLAAGAQAQDAPKTWTVSPGQSIQEAIDKAAPGDTVQVLPGEYVQPIEIKKDGVTLKGLEYEGERTTLKAKDAEENEALSVAVAVSAKNVVVEGFIIDGFSANSISVSNSQDVTVRGIIIRNAGNVGLSFGNVQRGVVDHVVISDASITGITLVDSSEITIANSEAFHCGVGLGATGTEQLTVDNSSFHHNAAGIVLLGKSAEDGKATAYTKILRSRIMGSDQANAAIASTFTHPFPTGIGLLVWGANETEISQCVISENASMGMAALAFDEKGARHLDKDAKRSGPPAEHLYAHHNTYQNNGRAPSADFTKVFTGIPAGDLYWDGLGERNQWQENTELKTYPDKLVVKQGGVHTDVIHFQ